MGETDMVTGAFGYTGRYLSRRLLDAGRGVRTLTAHPRTAHPRTAHPRPAHRPPPSGAGERYAGGREQEIEVHPFHFEDPAALTDSLRGVDTLYNTYWVRYTHAGTSYEEGVRNSRTLVEAAERAGVRRIVHISITNPSHDSFYEYYRGKARVEDAVRGSGLSHAIVRPTVLFGADDILVNNIAWLLRRLPVFVIPGDGCYRLRPVATADLADLCVRLGPGADDVTVDAVGPETFTFEGLVRAIAGAVGSRSRIVHAPAPVVTALLPMLGLLTRDVVLTSVELRGLMAEYVTTDGETTCPTRLTDHLAEHADEVGARYQSELARRR